MIIELPESLEAALKVQADAHGISPAAYARQVLQRDLEISPNPEQSTKPLKSGFGMLSKYGQAPSAEEIDANRSEMFRGFAEGID